MGTNPPGYQMQYYRTHPKQYRVNLQQRKQRSAQQHRKMRQWLRWFKRSLRCEECGESDWRTLDFHHVNPAQKGFLLARISSWVSWKRLWKEIEKCRVLCANCHRKATIPFEGRVLRRP